MRKAFIDSLYQLAERDDRIVLLTGDLGYMALEPFRERYPDRFINVGVAEQNMIGIATGLAEAGFIPYAWSIATFAALRPFEFIRNGPVFHRLPVRIVGMGAGFAYGHAGASHYGIEDVAILRTMPGLAVVIPADSDQAATATLSMAGFPGPVYYSLDKDGPAIPGLNGRFEPGAVQLVREGDDTIVISMGSVSREAFAAAEQLGAAAAIVSNFNPDPTGQLSEMLSRFRKAITVEAQTVTGGLGAFVAQVIATGGLRCILRQCAVAEGLDGTSGTQQNRWRRYGLDRESIVRQA